MAATNSRAKSRLKTTSSKPEAQASDLVFMEESLLTEEIVTIKKSPTIISSSTSLLATEQTSSNLTSSASPAPSLTNHKKAPPSAPIPSSPSSPSTLDLDKPALQTTITENSPFMSKKARLKHFTSQLLPRKGEKPAIFGWKIARLIGLMFALGAILGIIAFLALFFWFQKDLPDPTNVVRDSGFGTTIYDRNGELLYQAFTEEKRDPVALADISEYMKQATIAVEDKEFYNHGGFDWLTVLRIPYYFLTRGQVTGGSTLTQQLVKNVLLTNERTITRKFKELILSMQIESYYSKDEILNMYLNEAPYGGNLYGIGSAAKAFFNKTPAELTLVESAILAGLPQSPTRYSPLAGRTNDDGVYLWQVRADAVLRRLHEDSYITDEVYNQALADLENVTFANIQTDIQAPHFVFYIQDQLVEMYGEETISSGLSVYTTLDLNLQNQVQTIVSDEVADIEHYNVTNGAALVMVPKTGEILSMVGSRDYFDSDNGGQFNVVTQALRQPGSSIKPLTYLAYLQKGYTAASILADVPTSFVANASMKAYTPVNYDGKFRGAVNVRSALSQSLNIPAVKALATVGVEEFLNLAYNAGLTTFEPTAENLSRFGLAVTLGGAEVRMIDLTSAYAAFANQGKKVEPVSILKVQNYEGQTIYEYKPASGKQIFSEGETFIIDSILSDNAARSPAFGSNSSLNASPNIAVKTGTTNDLKDNWTIGWSQSFIVSAWVGNNDNSSMSGLVSGITGAAPIWRSIVNLLLANGYEAKSWEMPDNVEKIEVDAISGYPAHDGFATTHEYFVKGTALSSPDLIHLLGKICKGDNSKWANDIQVAGNDYDQKEFIILKENDPVSEDGVNRWQEAINAWVSSSEDQRYHVPTEYCGGSESNNGVYVTIDNISNEKNYSETKLKFKARADSGAGIKKIAIYVNGEKKVEKENEREFEFELELGAGKYSLYATAEDNNGKTAQSFTWKIGTGGMKWNEEDKPASTPTPVPTQTPVPTISPSPVPSPSPNPTITPEPTSP